MLTKGASSGLSPCMKAISDRAAARTVVVAIDGPAASGKGTLAKSLAKRYNLYHLDTGILYRLIGLRAIEAEVAFDDEDELAKMALEMKLPDSSFPLDQLRTEEVAQAASKISVLNTVRTALSELARGAAAQPPAGYQGAVLDGRDVGTVLCPSAGVKLYLMASAEERARRRAKEFVVRQAASEGGDIADAASVAATLYNQVLKDLLERDARDSGRKMSPLFPADDALILDTDELNAAAVLAYAVQHVGQCYPELKSSGSRR